MTEPRRMPTEITIRTHWAGRLWRAKGYDSEAEFMERGTCFACGLDGNERAHILARSAGGGDTPENIHILCGVCHKDSEYMDGGRYLAWVLERSPMDRLMSEAARSGFNLSAMMQAQPRG